MIWVLNTGYVLFILIQTLGIDTKGVVSHFVNRPGSGAEPASEAVGHGVCLGFLGRFSVLEGAALEVIGCVLRGWEGRSAVQGIKVFMQDPPAERVVRAGVARNFPHGIQVFFLIGF